MLIDISILDGVSEKDIARNITFDVADAEVADSRVSRVPMARCFRPLTYDTT